MSENELIHLTENLVTIFQENEYIEFKQNNDKPELIGKLISALSNGAALMGKNFAYLIYGVEDATHQIVGTIFKPNLEKIGNEDLELWLSKMLTPRLDFRIYSFLYTEKNIVLFHIPAAISRPTLFQQHAYIRVGSAVRPLNEFPDKERKLWQGPSTEFELELAKQNVTASEIVGLLDTQSVFDFLLKIPYPSTQNRVIEKLIEEKLVQKSNGHYHITNLGALLFAKDLKKFDLERKAPRVIKYKGKDKLHTEKDLMGNLGYGTGFQRLLNYISGIIPSNEIIELATRKTIEMYPSLALRELIANAIIHQDFRETGTYLTIEVFEDRVEISNPGKPIIDPIRFIDSYNSRNTLLANAMRRMGFCEEKGSGIDKVIAQSELFQLPAPDFRVTQNQTIAILYAHQELNEMNKKDKVRTAYQHCCLMYVTNQKMSNQSLRERFKIEEKNSSIVSRIIKDAIQENLIKPEDPNSKSRKFVSYVPYWA